MDPRSHAAFTPEILAEAARRFGLEPAQVDLLDGFESFIYNVRRDGQERILRISHSLRYTPPMIAAELDWIAFLADGGVPAARGLPALSGQLTEVIPDGLGGCFTAALFEKAPGGPPKREQWENGLLVEVGRLLGRMHALSKTYQPAPGRPRRQHWDEDPEDLAAFLPAGQEAIRERWQALRQALAALPRDSESYGLIHQDVHGGNFFVDRQGQITLFDFGDCCYAWFVYDLAMALFYVLPHRSETPEQLAFARRALEQLWAGYRQENTLSPEWLERIPLFLTLREIDLYLEIHRSMDLDNLDPWCASYMAGRRERIEAGQPFLDISYACD